MASSIDLSNMLKKDLEKGMPFMIDRKTIFKLLEDLEALNFIKVHRFKVKMETDNSVKDTQEITRIIATDSYKDISMEKIKNDPSLNNPFFKRDKKLPKSLSFLQKEPKPKKSTFPIITNEPHSSTNGNKSKSTI